jgi:hypothetical protein
MIYYTRSLGVGGNSNSPMVKTVCVVGASAQSVLFIKQILRLCILVGFTVQIPWRLTQNATIYHDIFAFSVSFQVSMVAKIQMYNAITMY